jgi:flagellar protein FliS
MSATPERLITLLYLGARAAIGQARIHMQENRIAERGAAITKAIKIVDEGLKMGLNMEAGGDIAANLSRLYDYIVQTLLMANLKADAEQLDIADRLLADLADAWQTSIDRPATGTQL